MAPTESIVVSRGDNFKKSDWIMCLLWHIHPFHSKLKVKTYNFTFFFFNGIVIYRRHKSRLQCVKRENHLANHSSDDVQCVRLYYRHAGVMCWVEPTCEVRNKLFTLPSAVRISEFWHLTGAGWQVPTFSSKQSKFLLHGTHRLQALLSYANIS